MRAGTRRGLRTGALAFLAAFGLAACSATATLAPGLVPVTLGDVGNPSDSTRDYTDSIAPGIPFAWGVRISNAANQDVVLDGYQLVDPSPGLEVLDAGLLPTVPQPVIGTPLQATPDLEATVAARPLAGATLGSASSPGWLHGGQVAFIIRVPSAGDYTLSGVRLRYHVAETSFDTTLNAALEVCAGAGGDASAACPFASPSAGP